MSGKPVIVLADKTTGGGVVLEGLPQSMIDGKPIARVGDKVSCPTHKGVFPIMTGDPDNLIDNKPVAYHGCKVACGCSLIASQTLFTTLGTSSGGTGGVGSFRASLAAGSAKDAPYGIQFQCTDEFGQPIVDRGYTLIYADGTSIRGKTDAEGLTAPFVEPRAAEVAINFDFATDTGKAIKKEELEA